MEPKLKAKELYNKFYNTDSHGNSVKVRESLAKQCALIAVDEILGSMGADRGYSFWVQVKDEIEKL
jgi:hypothetical protein